MTDERSRITRCLDKAGQRETWSYVAGIALGVTAGLANIFGWADVNDVVTDEALIGSIVAALLGTGAVAQVKRGRQRGEAVTQAVTQAVQGAPPTTASAPTTTTSSSGQAVVIDTIPPTTVPAPQPASPPVAVDNTPENAQ